MRVPRLLPPLLAGLAAVLVCAPDARAAVIATEAPCYQEGADVVTGGIGFAPSSAVAVYLEDKNIGLAATTAQGAFRNKFVAPNLPAGKHELVHAIGATDLTNSAITHFRLTEVSAGFTPAQGHLATLRVRFYVYGFAIFKSAPKVYVHYVRPGGGSQLTVLLGTAHGTCGHISRTSKRLLFPFVPRRGTWTLQFDTRKHYVKATATSNFAWVRRPVKVGG